MEYRHLGRSGLRVSSLALGAMTFGSLGQFREVGQSDLDGARRQIDMALDAGVNLIDTDDLYSEGTSEEIVGQTLAGRRERVLLATNPRFPMDPFWHQRKTAGDRLSAADLSLIGPHLQA